MDKQKQMIEEMAQCKNFNGYTCKSCGVKNACDRYILAEELYNAGYRKIPENAVVLTREEFEKLKSFIKSEEEVRQIMQEQMSPMIKELTNKEMNKNLDRVSALVRKETAEKFAERLKARLNIPVDYLDEKDIDEICKEIAEGKA